MEMYQYREFFDRLVHAVPVVMDDMVAGCNGAALNDDLSDVSGLSGKDMKIRLFLNPDPNIFIKDNCRYLWP